MFNTLPSNSVSSDVGGTAYQTFNADGTFNVPPGVDTVWLTGCGSGAAGGDDVSVGDSGGAGGGAENCADYLIYLGATPPATVAITVPVGGAADQHNDGNPGADTLFGTFLTLAGGVEGLADGNGGDGGGFQGGNGGSPDTDNATDGVGLGGIFSGGGGGGGAQSGATGFVGGRSYGPSITHNGTDDTGHGGGSLGAGGDTVAGVLPGPGGGGGSGGGSVGDAQAGGDGLLTVRWIT